MKSIFKHLSKITLVFLFFVAFSTRASDLPDPEALAKQYLKDLCTLNEQDFVRKYMLTQADAVVLINAMTKSSLEFNDEPSEKFSDSLELRSEVHSLVVKSYRKFKDWQHENKIDSSKLKYHSCEFELEKKLKIPYYGIDEMSIYILYDTLKYAISCDDFLFLKTKWVGGDLDDTYTVDKYFNTVYEEYDYAVVDTAAAVAYEEDEYYESTEVYEEQLATKKQLKIQKKIDSYNRKIDALYIKQYE